MYVKRWEPWHTPAGVKSCGCYERQCSQLFGNLKIELPHDSAILFPGIYAEERKSSFQDNHAPSYSLQHYSDQYTLFKGQNAETIGYYSACRNAMNLAICEGVKELWGHWIIKDMEYPK